MEIRESYLIANHTLKSWVELGAEGVFPLFEKSWIAEVSEEDRPLNQQEQKQARELLERLSRHRRPEHKRELLFSLSPQERNLLVRAFLQLVERNVRDKTREMH